MMSENREPLRRPMTDRERELLTLPSIASQMPVRFANGARWASFDGQCRGCGHYILSHLLTGRITSVVPSCATLEAAGICRDCRLVTLFLYRLHDDMRLVGQTERGWVTWARKPSSSDRVWRWFVRRCRGMLRGLL